MYILHTLFFLFYPPIRVAPPPLSCYNGENGREGSNLDKKDVIAFFDGQADHWDADMIRHEDVIAKILDQAGVSPGLRVLDVACGTGVLFPDYEKRGVTDLTAIDISPEMVKIARQKFPRVTVLCGDVEEARFPEPFDLIMIYNAFPHFPDPERLVKKLAGLLKPGGRLCIAHGMSRQAIDSHHTGSAKKVSVGLMEAGDLASLLGRYFSVDVVISDSRMYQVSGTVREGL